MRATENRMPFCIAGISIGNLLIMVAMVASGMTGLWEGGKIEANMQANIAAVETARDSDRAFFAMRLDQMSERIATIQADVRDVRSIWYKSRGAQ